MAYKALIIWPFSPDLPLVTLCSAPYSSSIICVCTNLFILHGFVHCFVSHFWALASAVPCAEDGFPICIYMKILYDSAQASSPLGDFPWIHSLNTYLLSTYYVSFTISGTGNIVLNLVMSLSLLQSLPTSGGDRKNTKIMIKSVRWW